MRVILAVVGLLAMCSVRCDGQATGVLVGVVYGRDQPGRPISGAYVEIVSANLRVVTDSGGRFRLVRVPVGTSTVAVRAVGYTSDIVEIQFEADLSIFRDFFLRPVVATLAEVKVSGSAARPVSPGMQDFARRREQGIGRFLDRAAIEKWDNGRTSEILRTLPGLVVHSGGSKAWVSSGRSVGSGRGALARPARRDDVLDKADIAAGAPLACYMDVYVDGALVYNSSALTNRSLGEQAPLFSVNSIPPSNIEAIEAYSGAAQIPAAFNRTNGGCGVLVIWTRAP